MGASHPRRRAPIAGTCGALAFAVCTSAGGNAFSVVAPTRMNTNVPVAAVEGDSTLWVEMRNVDLHIDSQAVMRVRSLRGEVIPDTRGRIA